jgi:nucleoside-diphosphate-sugar epimerase
MVARGLAGLVRGINKTLLGGRLRVPGLFIPEWLDGRAKPLRYTNRRLSKVLGWRPRYSRQEALEEIFSADAAARLAHEPGSVAAPARGAEPSKK